MHRVGQTDEAGAGCYVFQEYSGIKVKRQMLRSYARRPIDPTPTGVRSFTPARSTLRSFACVVPALFILPPLHTFNGLN